jgi:hypothetical protein
MGGRNVFPPSRLRSDPGPLWRLDPGVTKTSEVAILRALKALVAWACSGEGGCLSLSSIWRQELLVAALFWQMAALVMSGGGGWLVGGVVGRFGGWLFCLVVVLAVVWAGGWPLGVFVVPVVVSVLAICVFCVRCWWAVRLMSGGVWGRAGDWLSFV